MKQTSSISKNPLDSILPTFGQPLDSAPIWNESQHMFLTDQYTSAAGNTYYKGVRFCDRFVTIIHFGIYHNWTYVNEVELYAFNGKERKLIGKTKIDNYYHEETVRATTEKLLSNYINSQYLLNGIKADQKQVDTQVKELVDKSYISLLGTPDIQQKLDAVKPLLLEKD